MTHPSLAIPSHKRLLEGPFLPSIRLAPSSSIRKTRKGDRQHPVIRCSASLMPVMITVYHSLPPLPESDGRRLRLRSNYDDRSYLLRSRHADYTYEKCLNPLASKTLPTSPGSL